MTGPLRQLLTAAFLAALLVPGAPSRAAGPADAAEPCVECGVRKPGLRPRDLAILAEAVNQSLQAQPSGPSGDPFAGPAGNSFAASVKGLPAGCDPELPSALCPLPGPERLPASPQK